VSATAQVDRLEATEPLLIARGRKGTVEAKTELQLGLSWLLKLRRMMSLRRATLLVSWMLCLIAACDDSSTHTAVRSARSIEGRLWAPCCWTQTLDVHESELATALRAEIEQRTRRGETGDGIEDDLAARYGARIRAVPKGEDPRAIMPALVGMGLGTTLLALFILVRRTPYTPNISLTLGTQLDEYDAQLNAELARFEKP